jgi:hypothetical protein
MDEQSDGREVTWLDWLAAIERGDLVTARLIRGLIPDKQPQPIEEEDEVIGKPGPKRKPREEAGTVADARPPRSPGAGARRFRGRRF